MKILAKPGFRVESGSVSSCVCLYERLNSFEGVEIVEWSALKMLFGRFDILHLHWPDNILSHRYSVVVFFKLIALFVSMALVRLKGKKIVWTAHNLRSHEQLHPLLERIYWRGFGRLINGIITPMRFIEGEIRKSNDFSTVENVACCPFGDWSDYYTYDNSGAAALRKHFGISEKAKVVLWFGFIRRYKNIETLIKVFGESGLEDATLILAGQCKDSSYKEQIESLVADVENVRLVAEFIADEDVGAYFTLADICVFPFRDVTNTGSVRLALTFNKPVVVPDFPFSRELGSVLGEEWIICYDSEVGLKPHDIHRALENSRHLEKERIDWGDYHWDQAASKVYAFYQSVLG